MIDETDSGMIVNKIHFALTFIFFYPEPYCIEKIQYCTTDPTEKDWLREARLFKKMLIQRLSLVNEA